MLANESVKIGDHCWAILDDSLIVVLKVSRDGYDVCGPWELGASANELDIVEIIKLPSGYDNIDLYYRDELCGHTQEYDPPEYDIRIGDANIGGGK